MATKGEVSKRGERHSEAVERRPDGEAERDADIAGDRVPLDARSKEPVEPGSQARMERPDADDPGKDRQNLSDMADREPHDHAG